MEEKNLLREITFWSRLIGQHKSQPKSVVVKGPPTRDAPIRSNVLPTQLPAQRRVLLRKASLSVLLPNDGPRFAPPQQKPPCRSIVAATSSGAPPPQRPPPGRPVVAAPPAQRPPPPGRPVVAAAAMTTTTSPRPSSGRSVHVNPNFLAKGKVAHEGAVHVNPNFFKATKDAGAVVPTLMCKSVHINPRLLLAESGCGAPAPARAAPEESSTRGVPLRKTPRRLVARSARSEQANAPRVPVEEPLSSKLTLAQKGDKCTGKEGAQMPLNAPDPILATRVPKVQTVPPFQPCVLKGDLCVHPMSSPSRRQPATQARTPSSRRKYTFRSKTKLVKAPGSGTRVVRTTPHGSMLLALSRTKLVRLPGRARRSTTPRAEASTPSMRGVSSRALKTAHETTLMTLSRTKLVRLPQRNVRTSLSKSEGLTTAVLPSPVTPIASSVVTTSTVTKTRYRLQRSSLSSSQSATVRLARKVSTKYKYRSSSSSSSVTTPNSTFRLDRRAGRTSATTPTRRVSSSPFKVDHRAPSVGGRVRAHLLLSPLRRTTYSAFCNRVWAASPKLALSYKRLSRIGNNPGSRNNHQDSALVRIGGLLYKSSRNKLILSRSAAKAITPSSRPRTVVKRQLNMGGQVVYVRGDKFVMDRSGKTMQRIAHDSSSSSLGSSHGKRRRCISRVDIGGMTYIQKSPNVLVRTNIHRARNVVSNAKQKSIAFLAKKMRKINTPCLFYRRFGRCPRLEKGGCEHVHDPKCIDICKKFLQGNCHVEDCLLSHDVGPEKMPTCRFFLEACCVKDNCPYLHVKVSDRAPICRSFLQGYCADGPECLKRHILLCPEFDEKGSCSKGKCPFPHNIAPLHSRATCSDLPITKLKAEEESETHADMHSKRKRYYETDSVIEDLPQDAQSEESSHEEDAQNENVAEPEINDLTHRKRAKIGDLPSFIALE